MLRLMVHNRALEGHLSTQIIGVNNVLLCRLLLLLLAVVNNSLRMLNYTTGHAAHLLLEEHVCSTQWLFLCWH